MSLSSNIVLQVYCTVYIKDYPILNELFSCSRPSPENVQYPWCLQTWLQIYWCWRNVHFPGALLLRSYVGGVQTYHGLFQQHWYQSGGWARQHSFSLPISLPHEHWWQQQEGGEKSRPKGGEAHWDSKQDQHTRVWGHPPPYFGDQHALGHGLEGRQYTFYTIYRVFFLLALYFCFEFVRIISYFVSFFLQGFFHGFLPKVERVRREVSSFIHYGPCLCNYCPLKGPLFWGHLFSSMSDWRTCVKKRVGTPSCLKYWLSRNEKWPSEVI